MQVIAVIQATWLVTYHNTGGDLHHR